MIKVLFDGKCSLCSREIRYYQRIAPANTFYWCDVTEDKSLLDQYSLSYVDTLKSLHAVDQQEELHTGVDAFVCIWQALPKWRWLARFVKLPLVYPLSKFSYRKFADYRFSRLKHCQIALKSDKHHES